ncbi:MAG TPA: FMN-binding protein [Rhizomicrobium sp.]|nr:FMN-binding protein [Rhizomicrobium sp.]
MAKPIPPPQPDVSPAPLTPEISEPPPPAAAASENTSVPRPVEKPKQRVVTKPRPDSLYKDGEFTGNPVDIEYGLVQVSAIIRDGQIADVKWLQDPEDIDLSKQINQDAMPKLTRQAIAAQKSQVDLVTGATFTALGFRLSLSTALAQAAKSPP